jgi:hypothetical protein
MSWVLIQTGLAVSRRGAVLNHVCDRRLCKSDHMHVLYMSIIDIQSARILKL